MLASRCNKLPSTFPLQTWKKLCNIRQLTRCIFLHLLARQDDEILLIAPKYLIKFARGEFYHGNECVAYQVFSKLMTVSFQKMFKEFPFRFLKKYY